MALDPAGRLLAPTNRGLMRQSATGWELINAEQGIISNDISTVFQDREGSIWLGLLGSGLARWLGYGEWQSWTAHEGLSRESVWSITRDGNGRMWVGTQFELNYAEEKDGRLVWKPLAAEGLEMVRALASNPDGTLWIGGEPGGLRQFNPKGDKERCLAAGMDQFINKPIDAERFVEVVEAAAGCKRLGPSGNSAKYAQPRPLPTSNA